MLETISRLKLAVCDLHVTSPPSIDALQNDQSLPHASDIRLTEYMECQPMRGLVLLCLDTCRLDDLRPHGGLFDDEFVEFGRGRLSRDDAHRCDR
jgi:hypothetical protein